MERPATLNTDFAKEILKLNYARKQAARYTKQSHDLSSNMSSLIRNKAKTNGFTLKQLATESGIPMHSIVNWLCGSSTRALPEDEAVIMWRVLRNKKSVSPKLAKLNKITDGMWRRLSSRSIANLCGISATSVLTYKRKYNKPKRNMK